MKFILIMMVLIYAGRKIGWGLTKGLLYRLNKTIAVIILSLWGGGIGLAVGYLDWNLNPHWVIKVIFGLFGGLYVAQPNYGLLQQQQSDVYVDLNMRNRDAFITLYSQICFALVAGVMVYFNVAYHYGRS